MNAPLNREGKPMTPIVIDTNQGGIRTYLCGCGALIMWELWERHQRLCVDSNPIIIARASDVLDFLERSSSNPLGTPFYSDSTPAEIHESFVDRFAP